MGALTELGLVVPDSNRVQRSMQHVVASKPGAWLFSKFLYGLDKPLFKLSKGRITAPSLLAGLPVVPPVLPVPASLQEVHLVPRQEGEVVLQLHPGHHLQAVVEVGGRHQQVDCPDAGVVPWGQLSFR